jgi:hypothetical protein
MIIPAYLDEEVSDMIKLFVFDFVEPRVKLISIFSKRSEIDDGLL